MEQLPALITPGKLIMKTSSKTTRVRIIGDVCGNFTGYTALVNSPTIDLSVQLGDFGNNLADLSRIDPQRHKILPGNEDRPEKMTAHFLGDYGILWKNIFYVRGEKSDRPLDSRDDEEMKTIDMQGAFDAYKKLLPKIVITHAVPTDIKYRLYKPEYPSRYSSTGRLLSLMFAFHRPKIWVFSHPRIYFRSVEWGCTMVGLEELDYIDINMISQVQEKEVTHGSEKSCVG